MNGDSGTWTETTLGNLGEISGGGTPSTQVASYWDGGISWLVPNEVTKNRSLFITRTERTITTAGLASSAAKLLPAGTVLMTSRATIGLVTINTVPMATNQGFINVVCNLRIVANEFFAFWIQQHRSVFEDRANGVTFKEISKANFRTIPITLPPLAEQRAIAHALRTVRSAGEARRREIALERERKASLMHHLFTHGTRNEPTRDTALGSLPESWRVVPLGSLVQMVSGGTPSKDRPDWWQGTVPWVSPKDMKQPRLADVADHITEEAARNGSRIVPTGTVFIVVRGMILVKDVPIAITEAPMAFNQDMKAILPSESLAGDYLLYVLQHLKRELNRLTGTSAHGTRRIGTSSLETLMLPFPNLDEQHMIGETLRACDAKIAALEREAALHDELFRAMLEELMSGRLSALPLANALPVESATQT